MIYSSYSNSKLFPRMAKGCYKASFKMSIFKNLIRNQSCIQRLVRMMYLWDKRVSNKNLIHDFVHHSLNNITDGFRNSYVFRNILIFVFIEKEKEITVTFCHFKLSFVFSLWAA